MSTHSNVAHNVECTKNANYRDLTVWARAMDLVEICYKLSKQIPPSEIYGLTSQIRGAAASVPSHIAEGHEGKPSENTSGIFRSRTEPSKNWKLI